MTDQSTYPANFKRVSWGAIFGGAIVALMFSLMLGLVASRLALQQSIRPQKRIQ